LRSSSDLIRVGAKEMASYYGGRVCGAGGRRTDAADPKPETGKAVTAAKVASADAPQEKHKDTMQAAPAGTPRRQFWSNADDEAAVEALLVAQESAGVAVASLVRAGAATSAEPAPVADDATGLIGELMPALAGEAATQDIASWPSSAHIVWGGVTASTIDRETALAARREAASSDG
jgi:hypothetical protein